MSRSQPPHPDRGARRVTVVGYPGVQVLDVTGPHEVFALANRFAVEPPAASGLAPRATAPPYRVELVARVPDGTTAVRSTGGLLLGLDRTVRAEPGRTDRSIDTLVVAGGEGTRQAATDPDLLAWLRAVAPRCRRLTSVCSGAFILAAAGLLDGRRVTTHWSEADLLARLFPAVSVDPDPIFVRDGPVVTSAGITAGMDLALALVEEDLGPELALAVSRWLVMFVKRPGGQSQFSAQLAGQMAERRPLRELQGWIADHLDGDLSVPVLAARVAMSPRHFARVFRDEVGVTPAQYVERQRVELARRLLETTDHPVTGIARRAGFGTAETLQRAFRRSLHTSPGDYRRLFTRPAVPALPEGEDDHVGVHTR